MKNNPKLLPDFRLVEVLSQYAKRLFIFFLVVLANFVLLGILIVLSKLPTEASIALVIILLSLVAVISFRFISKFWDEHHISLIRRYRIMVSGEKPRLEDTTEGSENNQINHPDNTPKHELPEERRWHAFVFGFAVGMTLTAMVAGLVVTLVGIPFNGNGSSNPCGSDVEIIASRTIVERNQEISLSLPQPGECMVSPIVYYWNADSGSGLPKGPTQETTVTWVAPDILTPVEIRVAAIDAKRQTISRKITIPIVNR